MKWVLPNNPVTLEPFPLPAAAHSVDQTPPQAPTVWPKRKFERERDILSDVKQILNSGSWASEQNDGDTSKSETRWGIIEEILTDRDVFSILELGSGNGAMSVALARKFEDSATVISYDKGVDLGTHIQLRDKHHVKNNIIATSIDVEAAFALPHPREVAKRAVQLPVHASEPRQNASGEAAPWYSFYDFDAVLVSKLEDFAGDLLPHELEIALAGIILKSRVTFVNAPLPNTRFFSYWENVEDLVNKAVAFAQRHYGTLFAPPGSEDDGRSSDSENLLLESEVKVHKKSPNYWGPEEEKYVTVEWKPTVMKCPDDADDQGTESASDDGDRQESGDSWSSNSDDGDGDSDEDSAKVPSPAPAPTYSPSFFRETYFSAHHLSPFQIIAQDRATLFRGLLQECRPTDEPDRSTTSDASEGGPGYYLIRGSLQMYTPKLFVADDSSSTAKLNASTSGGSSNSTKHSQNVDGNANGSRDDDANSVDEDAENDDAWYIDGNDEGTEDDQGWMDDQGWFEDSNDGSVADAYALDIEDTLDFGKVRESSQQLPRDTGGAHNAADSLDIDTFVVDDDEKSASNADELIELPDDSASNIVIFDGMEVEYTAKDARDLRILLADYPALVALNDADIVKLVLQTKRDDKLGDPAALQALDAEIASNGGTIDLDDTLGGDAAAVGTGRRMLGVMRKTVSFHKYRVWQYLERLGNQTKVDEAQEKERSTSRDGSWSSDNRKEQAARSIEETAAYMAWKNIMKNENLGSSEPWTMLTYGSYLSLLSIRLAKSHPASTVVSALRTRQVAHSSLKMVELLELHNLFVCQTDLNQTVATAVEQPNDPFDYQILDLDVFETLLCEDDDWAFERFLGKLLRIAKVTFLRIPTWPALIKSLQVLAEVQDLPPTANTFGAALRGATFAAFARQFRSHTCSSDLCYEGSTTKFSLFSGVVAAAAALEGIGPVSIAYVSSGDVNAVRISVGDHAPSTSAGKVSLYSLLHLGVVPKVRAELFRLYMQMEVSYDDHDDKEYLIAPWNVRYHMGAGGGYLLSDDLVKKHRWKDPNADSRFEPIAAEISAVEAVKQRRRDRGRFSFIEWHSGVGSLSVDIAQRFPQATVVSVTDSELGAAEHLETLEALNITNNRVCSNSDIGYSLLSTTYESPEFLRFQVIGQHILDLVRMQDSGKVLGKWLALALTTFLQMPTDEHLSMGLTIFGPSAPPSFLDGATAFSMHFHPNTAYKQGGVRLLSSLARLRGRNHVRFSQHTNGVLQFDILAMNRSVGHHFNWQLDGHDRKYKMHVLRNETAEQELLSAAPRHVNLTVGNHLWPSGQVSSVYLTRELDGSHIPYDTIYGITLIAMLRLGLVKQQRGLLYEEFLKLPLFEDMAPWNIVIIGNSVGYIDYDTRAHTFDKDLESVYRVMSAMFNYKVRCVHARVWWELNGPPVQRISCCVPSPVIAANC